MDDIEKPSNATVIKITENSEKASEDTEVMSSASKSIRGVKEISSGSMITNASKNETSIQKDHDDQEEQKYQDDQGDQMDQGDNGVHGEITSELHLESIHSSMQSLVMEGSLHSMISMESGSMITIASTDEKTFQEEQKDQDDQVDQGNHWVHGDLWVNGDQKDQEPEVKQHKAKPREYICAIVVSLICIILPFTWYHLSREHKEDLILPYNRGEDVQSNDSCPYWHLLGDNYCDDEANIAECGYDFNDCCEGQSDRSLCTDCICYIPEDRKILLEKQFKMQCASGKNEEGSQRILPSQQGVKDPPKYGWSKFFGDGLCDLGFNTEEYYFDIGDCCLENAQCMSSTLISTKTDGDCEEDICIQSNIFCVKEELGDGICQGHNNGEYCDHDLGDCCLATESSQTNCTCNCQCFMDDLYQIPWFLG